MNSPHISKYFVRICVGLALCVALPLAATSSAEAASAEVVTKLDLNDRIEQMAADISGWDMRNANQWPAELIKSRVETSDSYLAELKKRKKEAITDLLEAKVHALTAGLYGYKIASREITLGNKLSLRSNILKAISIENDHSLGNPSPSRRMLERAVEVLETVKTSTPLVMIDSPGDSEKVAAKKAKQRAERIEDFDGQIKTLKSYLAKIECPAPAVAVR